MPNPSGNGAGGQESDNAVPALPSLRLGPDNPAVVLRATLFGIAFVVSSAALYVASQVELITDLTRDVVEALTLVAIATPAAILIHRVGSRQIRIGAAVLFSLLLFWQLLDVSEELPLDHILLLGSRDPAGRVVRRLIVACFIAGFFLNAYLLVYSLDVAYRRLAAERRQLDHMRVQRADAEQHRQRAYELARYQESVREQERQRIAREVHDQLGALLTRIKLDVSRVRKRSPAVAAQLAPAVTLADDAMLRVQQIAADLRPPVLDMLGLSAAVEEVLAALRRRSELRCRADISDQLDRLFDPRTATTLFRIVEELLTNVERHAHASSVSVAARVESGSMVLTVADDGVGVSAAALSSASSYGIISVQERSRELGGSIQFDSPAAGGTRVVARIPTARAGGEEA